MIAGSRSPRSRLLPALALVAALPLVWGVIAVPATGQEGGTVNSARYRFEGNKWLALDLAVGDVHVESIKFEWPATLLRVKTSYKATVKVANGSSAQVRVGIALALYDQDSKLVGAGTTGTTLGTIDPGDSAQFDVVFNHVTGRLEQASQFHIALEAK